MPHIDSSIYIRKQGKPIKNTPEELSIEEDGTLKDFLKELVSSIKL